MELATQSGHKVDGIRPTLVTAGADANTLRLTLTWDKALDEDSVPSPHSNAFTLSVNGDRRGITGVSVDGKVVTLILASSVMSGDDATVSYGVPFRTYDPLKDILGNYAANNSATVAIGDDTTPPTVSGDTSISYAENRTDQVASYSATDPENETVTWAALAGADAGDFAIADGVLTFRQSPDHEQPADSNRDNDYLVTVRAWDGTNYGTLDVTVTVSGETDVDFAENRTGQVGRYTATDPEGETVMLSLAGTDAADFELSATVASLVRCRIVRTRLIRTVTTDGAGLGWEQLRHPRCDGDGHQHNEAGDQRRCQRRLCGEPHRPGGLLFGYRF